MQRYHAQFNDIHGYHTKYLRSRDVKAQMLVLVDMALYPKIEANCAIVSN